MSRNPSAPVFSLICLIVLKNLPHSIQCGHVSYTHPPLSSLGRGVFRTPQVDKFPVFPARSRREFAVGKQSALNVSKTHKFSDAPLVTTAALIVSLGIALLKSYTSPGYRYQQDERYLPEDKVSLLDENNKNRGEVQDTDWGELDMFKSGIVALAAVADAVSIVYHTLGIMARLGLGIMGNGNGSLEEGR